jgi:hypothetical protein
MEKRSRRRTRDLVIQPASQGLSESENGCADIHVIETLADVMFIRGIPEHVRSDNGAETTAKVIRS